MGCWCQCLGCGGVSAFTPSFLWGHMTQIGQCGDKTSMCVCVRSSWPGAGLCAEGLDLNPSHHGVGT